MKKKPIIINSVFIVDLTKPNLRRLYDVLDDEERCYDMTVSGSYLGHVTVRLEVSQYDEEYFSNLLNTVEAVQI